MIGRKNWLFSNTARGATASALVYGIIATAKESGLVPADYLEYLFERLPAIDTADITQLDMLLPWTEQTRARCLKHDRG